MKIGLIISLISFAASARHSIFGVYRGELNAKQSCTVSILEQSQFQSVSVLIDQNPYVFVNSIQLVNQLSQRTPKIALASIERDFKDSVEIIIDSKSQKIDVTTQVGGISARCLKAAQIRHQD